VYRHTIAGSEVPHVGFESDVETFSVGTDSPRHDLLQVTTIFPVSNSDLVRLYLWAEAQLIKIDVDSPDAFSPIAFLDKLVDSSLPRLDGDAARQREGDTERQDVCNSHCHNVGIHPEPR